MKKSFGFKKHKQIGRMLGDLVYSQVGGQVVGQVRDKVSYQIYAQIQAAEYYEEPVKELNISLTNSSLLRRKLKSKKKAG